MRHLGAEGEIPMAGSAPVPASRPGVHALVFTGQRDTTGTRRAVTAAKTAGYDLIELDPRAVDTTMTARLLAEHGLQAAGSLGLTPATDVSSEDPGTVAAGERLTRHLARHVGRPRRPGTPARPSAPSCAPPQQQPGPEPMARPAPAHHSGAVTAARPAHGRPGHSFPRRYCTAARERYPVMTARPVQVA
jgi:hypothetical protein